MMPTHEDLNTVAMHNLSKTCRLLPQRCYTIAKMCFRMCVFYIHISTYSDGSNFRCLSQNTFGCRLYMKNSDWNHKCKCEHFFPNFVWSLSQELKCASTSQRLLAISIRVLICHISHITHCPTKVALHQTPWDNCKTGLETPHDTEWMILKSMKSSKSEHWEEHCLRQRDTGILC